MADIVLHVVFPLNVELPITVKVTDTPRTVALSGPPLAEPVVPVHKGRCLCPYFTLQSQGVSNGDVIVLCPVSASPRAAKPRKPLLASDDVFGEVLRLADVAFSPFEVSSYGATMSQQMFTEAQESTGRASTARGTTVIPKAAEEVSAAPLPGGVPCEGVGTGSAGSRRRRRGE
jgi:hypothetical protein